MTVLDRASVAELVKKRSLGRRVPSRSGLAFHLAGEIETVIEAWRLVYRAYLRAGLIGENPYGIHLVPRAVHPLTGVGVGCLDGNVCATISAYLDRSGGLPLDAVYPAELDRLREEGRTLVEVGLLADRRGDLSRSLDATLDLMKYGFFHGLHQGGTDLVIGVHPHHARFYQRIFAFEPFGAESTCPSVNHAPVVGLRLDLASTLMLEPLPKGLRYFVESPLGMESFEGRLELTPDRVRGTVIEEFLADRCRKVWEA